jgi:hypothetical protein
MFKTKYIVVSLILIALFSSCKKEEKFDVEGDPEVKFFTNSTNSGDAPVNSMSFNVVNIPTAGSALANLSHTFPNSIKIPVFATKPVSDDVTIGAELDNSLVAKYNESHGTSYTPFPTNILTTTNLNARIVKGATTSTDSLTIPIDLASLNALTEKTYMAPIKLTTVSNKGIGAITSAETQTIYIVANMEFRRIKYLGTTADITGTLITNRTPWAVTFNSAPTSVGGIGSVLDGSTTTYSRWSASPVVVDVNMQDTKNVTAIRLYTTNSATLIPTQISVSLSNDGINYDPIGSPLRANLTYASSYNYIVFYKPIPAKYIRLNLLYGTSTNTQNFRVTELDVYAN